MKVLYATDNYKPARDALRVLETLADRDEVDITVLSIATLEIIIPESPTLILDPLDKRRTHALELVDETVELLRTFGFRAVGKTAEGDPAEQILETIERDWYDLAVLGAGSRSWLGHLLLGSASTHVLHAAPCSVMLVHDIQDEPKGKILIGADGSRGSEFAVRSIADFADPMRTSVTVLGVAQHPPAVYPLPGAPIAVPAEPDPRVMTRLKRRAERNVAHAIEILGDRGFTTRPMVTSGDPVGGLLKECDGGAYDLVAVGSRGHGSIRRALVGSVSDQIARHAPATLVGRRLVV
jgi:nucleotide-binding universal stress UspA family protein